MSVDVATPLDELRFDGSGALCDLSAARRGRGTPNLHRDLVSVPVADPQCSSRDSANQGPNGRNPRDESRRTAIIAISGEDLILK